MSPVMPRGGEPLVFQHVKKLSAEKQVSQPALCLQPDQLRWIQQTNRLYCTLDSTVPIVYGVNSSWHIPRQCTPPEFQMLDLAGQIVYMQPQPGDVKLHLAHYEKQKVLHPEIGAVLVLPATCTEHEHVPLAAFQLVHEYRRREYAFQHYSSGKIATAKQNMRVYVSQPSAQQAPGTVAPPAHTDIMFNLPCTIAGRKSQVKVDTRSLIDTGCATASLISATLAAKLQLSLLPCAQQFAMADGSISNCSGVATVRITIQKHTFTVRAYVVTMNEAFDLILGQQWLIDHRAVIDYERQTLTLKKGNTACTLRAPKTKTDYADRKQPPSKPLSAAAVSRHLRKGGKVYELRFNDISDLTDNVTDNSTSAEHRPSNHREAESRIRRRFQDRFVDELPPNQKGPQAPPIAELEPDARPVFTPAYRASPRERDEMLKQTFEGIAAGRVRNSTSPWGSGVLFVVKPDGSLRMCVDYRRLNKQTIKQRHPIPRIDDVLDKFSGAKVFSLLDLKAGYAQIRLHPDDIPKSAFVTPFGQFEYTIIPFGMSNAVSAFTKVMQGVLAPVLGRCAELYLDEY
jgi:predicted aspartyl protease